MHTRHVWNAVPNKGRERGHADWGVGRGGDILTS